MVDEEAHAYFRNLKAEAGRKLRKAGSTLRKANFMESNYRWLVGATAVLTGAVLSLGGILPASADTPSGTVDFRIVNGSGSDTTQDLNNGLASKVLNDHDGLPGTPDRLVLGSFDATIPAGRDNWIQTRPGGTWLPRPNGSGQGVTGLDKSKTGAPLSLSREGILNDSYLDTAPMNTSPNANKGAGDTTVGNPTAADLQFARSSSAPSLSKADPAGKYQYIPLAIDAVSFAVHSSNSVIPKVGSAYDLPKGAAAGEVWPGTARLKLTLKNIFGDLKIIGNGTATLYSAATGGISRTVGNQDSGAQIVPFLPQDGSGTRSFWISELGISSPLPSHLKDTYHDQGVTKAVQEHDGSVLNLNNSAPANEKLRNRAIVPFSIAQHIAQTRVGSTASYYSGTYAGVTVTDRRAGATLGQIDSVTPLVSSGLNTSFPVKRPVFTVVEVAEFNSVAVAGDPQVGKVLRDTFGGSSAAAYTVTVMRGGSAVPVLTDFGFGSLGTGTDFVINGQPVTGVVPGEVSPRFRAKA